MKQIEQKLKSYLDSMYIISHSYSTLASYRMAIVNQNKTGFRDYLQETYNIDELKFVKQTKQEKFDVYATLRDFVVFLDKNNYKPKSITTRLAAIKEVKLAKNIEDRHLIQGAFYNYLLGQIQEFTPKTFSIINGEREETIYEYSEYESLLFKTINASREILQGGHVSPTHGSGLSPWTSYCNKKAIETNDVSLVAGISAKTKGKFVDSGYKTVQDLAGAKLEDLIELKGVAKKTAIKYVRTAQALHTNEPIIIDKDAIDFPNCKVEIFLDLEGIDPTMANENTPQIDYLIGILVRENSEEKYIPFTAKDTDHEKEMLLEFLEYVKKQNDYVIYHYHHYEKTHLTKMMENYEVDRETQNMVFDHMIDIHKVATNSVVFPTYGTSLKQIAPYLGFHWRHKDVNATESILIYFDFIKNPSENKERYQKVVDYNEDDCVATRVIKDWLASIK